MTAAKAKDWTRACWPGTVTSLHQVAGVTGDIAVGVLLADGHSLLELALPADHVPPTIGEQLFVTLQRAQP